MAEGGFDPASEKQGKKQTDMALETRDDESYIDNIIIENVCSEDITDEDLSRIFSRGGDHSENVLSGIPPTRNTSSEAGTLGSGHNDLFVESDAEDLFCAENIKTEMASKADRRPNYNRDHESLLSTKSIQRVNADNTGTSDSASNIKKFSQQHSQFLLKSQTEYGRLEEDVSGMPWCEGAEALPKTSGPMVKASKTTNSYDFAYHSSVQSRSVISEQCLSHTVSNQKGSALSGKEEYDPYGKPDSFTEHFAKPTHQYRHSDKRTASLPDDRAGGYRSAEQSDTTSTEKVPRSTKHTFRSTVTTSNALTSKENAPASTTKTQTSTANAPTSLKNALTPTAAAASAAISTEHAPTTKEYAPTPTKKATMFIGNAQTSIATMRNTLLPTAGTTPFLGYALTSTVDIPASTAIIPTSIVTIEASLTSAVTISNTRTITENAQTSATVTTDVLTTPRISSAIIETAQTSTSTISNAQTTSANFLTATGSTASSLTFTESNVTPSSDILTFTENASVSGHTTTSVSSTLGATASSCFPHSLAGQTPSPAVVVTNSALSTLPSNSSSIQAANLGGAVANRSELPGAGQVVNLQHGTVDVADIRDLPIVVQGADLSNVLGPSNGLRPLVTAVFGANALQGFQGASGVVDLRSGTRDVTDDRDLQTVTQAAEVEPPQEFNTARDFQILDDNDDLEENQDLRMDQSEVASGQNHVNEGVGSISDERLREIRNLSGEQLVREIIREIPLPENTNNASCSVEHCQQQDQALLLLFNCHHRVCDSCYRGTCPRCPACRQHCYCLFRLQREERAGAVVEEEEGVAERDEEEREEEDDRFGD